MSDLLQRKEDVKRMQRMNPGCAPTGDVTCSWVDEASAEIERPRSINVVNGNQEVL